MADPQVVTRDEWLAARKRLLAAEKKFTRQRDALNAERRKLPMTEVTTPYVIAGRDGPARLAPVEYNYRVLAELGPAWQGRTGELHGISAFLRRGDRVFHTYSGYARGTDLVNGTYNWLDLTARGRQEDWEQPAGRSDGPLMAWLRHHDRY